MEHLKTINACFKCLQLDHKASVCKARLKCPYCHQVGKTNTKHNTALCAYLDDQEFANAVKTKSPENESEPNQAEEETFATNTDFFERPIRVGETVHSTYSKFMEACEQYPDDDEYEDEEYEYEDDDDDKQMYMTNTE